MDAVICPPGQSWEATVWSLIRGGSRLGVHPHQAKATHCSRFRAPACPTPAQTSTTAGTTYPHVFCCGRDAAFSISRVVLKQLHCASAKPATRKRNTNTHEADSDANAKNNWTDADTHTNASSLRQVRSAYYTTITSPWSCERHTTGAVCRTRHSPRSNVLLPSPG